MPVTSKNPAKYLSASLLRRAFICHDCYYGLSILEFFMVKDQLWAEFGCDATHNWEGKPWSVVENNRRGYLCLPCFEKRLKRPITPRDLTDAPCNELLKLKLKAGI